MATLDKSSVYKKTFHHLTEEQKLYLFGCKVQFLVNLQWVSTTDVDFKGPFEMNYIQVWSILEWEDWRHLVENVNYCKLKMYIY